MEGCTYGMPNPVTSSARLRLTRTLSTLSQHTPACPTWQPRALRTKCEFGDPTAALFTRICLSRFRGIRWDCLYTLLLISSLLCPYSPSTYCCALGDSSFTYCSTMIDSVIVYRPDTLAVTPFLLMQRSTAVQFHSAIEHLQRLGGQLADSVTIP